MRINSIGTGNAPMMEVKAGAYYGRLSTRGNCLDIISMNLRTVDTETGKQVVTPSAFVYLYTLFIIHLFSWHNSPPLLKNSRIYSNPLVTISLSSNTPSRRVQRRRPQTALAVNWVRL